MFCVLLLGPYPGRLRLASRLGMVKTMPTGWRLSLWTRFPIWRFAPTVQGPSGVSGIGPRVARPRIPGPTSGALFG
eukprot:8064436-Pyramimonas_sp.AAC.1